LRVRITHTERQTGTRKELRRWEDNIKMKLRETFCMDVNWTELAENLKFNVRELCF